MSIFLESLQMKLLIRTGWTLKNKRNERKTQWKTQIRQNRVRKQEATFANTRQAVTPLRPVHILKVIAPLYDFLFPTPINCRSASGWTYVFVQNAAAKYRAIYFRSPVGENHIVCGGLTLSKFVRGCQLKKTTEVEVWRSRIYLLKEILAEGDEVKLGWHHSSAALFHKRRAPPPDHLQKDCRHHPELASMHRVCPPVTRGKVVESRPVPYMHHSNHWLSKTNAKTPTWLYW